jgi:type II secretory pathway component GspD/PulD (secretin)
MSTTMSNRIFASLAALCLAATALAQTTEPASNQAPAAPAVQVAGAEPAAAAVTRDKDTLSVDFPDEDIKTILRNVADLFELNLVVPDTLVGKTSIKLRDVTWRQIFQVVLSPVGYTYLEEGNIIKIVSNEALTQEPAATEVFILNNAKAGDIKPTVDGLVDAAAGGKILIDARSNALVVTERPSRMSRIRTIIDQLDKATAQVMIESKFVEVTDRDIRNIGVNWASLQGMQFGVGGIQQDWQRGRNQTSTNGFNRNDGTSSTNTSNTGTGNTSGTTGSTLTGTTNSSTVTPTTTTTVNTPATTTLTTNVVVTGTTPSTTNTSTTNTGTPSTAVVQTTANTTTTGSSGSTTSGTNSSTTNTVANTLANTASSAVNNLLGLTNGGTQSRLATAVFSASDFNVIVSALNSQNNTKVISNPTVVTLNNSEATLNIGQEFPVPSYTYNSERGTFEVSGFTYKPIGVLLKVTPQVNGQGNIRLALEPEISQQNGSTSFGGAGGASIPIIATRKVKTQISLKDGYTAGIGGLISTQKDHGGTKVPVLGSVPILGRLFSSKNVNDSTSNLLIFITAKTVNPDGAAPEHIFTPESLEAVGMSPGAKK